MRHKHSVTEDPTKLVGIAALAATIGAAIALLFAPKSGEQTRKAIGRRAKKLQGQAERTLDEAEGAAQDAKVRLQTKVDNAVRDAKAETKTVKKRATSTVKKAAPAKRGRPPKAQ